MNYNDIKKLMIASALNEPTAKFSAEDVHEAARNALAEYFGVEGLNSILYLNPSDFRLIDEVIEEVLPKNLQNILGPWADVKSYGYNDRVVFHVNRGASERRFKEVVVPGQAAGIYRARRLDSDVVEVETHVMTAGYNVILEEILTGTANIAKLVQLIAEGFAEKIYVEMISAFRSVGALSRFSGTAVGGSADTAIDFDVLDTLIAKAGAHGPVTIFGFRSALSLLSNQANVTDATWSPSRASEDLSDIRNHGRVLIYKGTPIVQLENYLLDDDSWAFNENMLYIIPGGNKPVKVALHGPVNTQEVNIPSGGKEWHAFRRAGVAVVSSGGIATYEVDGAEEGRY